MRKLRGQRVVFYSGAAGLMLLIAGCGQKTLATRATSPVHGNVTLADGKPLDTCAVAFEPVNIEQGTPCEALIKKDGTYEANAYPGKSGLAPGEYRVSIVPYDAARHGKYAGALPAIPAKYTSPETSEIKFTVVADQDNVLDIPLK